MKKRALQSLIDNKLKKIELAKYSIKNNTLQVNNYLNSISSNNRARVRNCNSQEFKKKGNDKNYEIDGYKYQSLNDVNRQTKKYKGSSKYWIYNALR